MTFTANPDQAQKILTSLVSEYDCNYSGKNSVHSYTLTAVYRVTTGTLMDMVGITELVPVFKSEKLDPSIPVD